MQRWARIPGGKTWEKIALKYLQSYLIDILKMSVWKK